MFNNRFNAIIHNFILSNGFLVIMIVVFIGFSLGSRSFLTLTNILSLMHASSPLLVLSSGLAMVVITHNLDISVGSVAFLSTVIGSILYVRYHFSPLMAILMIFLVGIGAGALNGFLVTKVKINSFIVTLGTMMALRGIGLQIVKGRTISIPSNLSEIGGFRIGPIYFDIFFSLIFIFFLYLLHTRTSFGRYIMAIGSDPEVSKRMSIRVEKITFITFILSGFFASLGGFLLVLQLGVVSLRMGIGTEFVALAAIVIGGISLFGGEGSLIPGLLCGVYTLNIIDSGLYHLGASPYVYPFVRGGLIFLAMYVDSLRSAIRMGRKVKISRASE